jgi:hypothetical protein
VAHSGYGGSQWLLGCGGDISRQFCCVDVERKAFDKGAEEEARIVGLYE